MNPALMLLVLLVSAAAAESIRETETMDRRGFYDDFSGDFEDDEDVNESTDYTTSPDSDYNEADVDSSGSGDSDEDDATFDMETVTLGNKIPEDDIAPNKTPEDLDPNDNEIVPIHLSPKELEPSNEISMASTGNAGFFSKEVVVALVAGTVVGLVFAVLIIVLLVMRLQKKDVNNCDSVKKPIYKKAPTIEV